MTMGVDIGVSAMNESGPLGFHNGVGTVTEPGPAWGLRIGVDLLTWLGIEGRYLGMYDSARSSVSPAGSIGYLTSGVDALARLTAPLPYVHPYVVGGAGYYAVSLAGSSRSTGASVMHSSSQPALVVGFGVDVPLSWHLSVGAEADYHHQSNETYSSVTTNGIDGGDLTTFNIVMRARL
jgi:opacity protein-like surface antigen